MKAEIVSTGTELLLGKNCNEDARILCKVLARCGIDVHRYTTVGDNVERIAQAYIEALERADIVISTGGLGGTDDDLSKQAASKATGVPLEKNEKIENFLMEKRVLSERIRRSFSSIPEGALLFENSVGVAPGIVMKLKNKKYLILLPGPPAELKSILKNGLEEFLNGLTDAYILNESVRIFGMRESEVEEIVHDLTLSENPTVATFLKKGWIEVSITAKAQNKMLAEKMVEKVKKEVLKRFPSQMLGSKGEDLVSRFHSIFLRKNLTLSVAESITAGMLSSKIVDLAGASAFFMGGVVVYSNESKVKLLGVNKKIIEERGAVSKECAQDMAKKVRKLFSTDVGISLTGIAGPTGGTSEKPVGTVWFSVNYEDSSVVWKKIYAGRRNEIRKAVVEDVIEQVIRIFSKKA